jgi:hypothetical protein
LLHLDAAGLVFRNHIGLLVIDVTESVGDVFNHFVILGTASVGLVRLSVENLRDHIVSIA